MASRGRALDLRCSLAGIAAGSDPHNKLGMFKALTVGQAERR